MTGLMRVINYEKWEEKMDNNYKNRIITISGEPVSGKSTTLKKMIEKLKQKGIREENIHYVQTGEIFRKYMNRIVELIVNFDNREKAMEIARTPEIQSLIKDQKSLNDLMQTIAKVRNDRELLENFTVDEANKNKDFSEIREKVDHIIDTSMEKLGKKINSEKHPNEIWLIDSRLAFSNIPDSFSIRLTTNPEVAGKRLFQDKNRGKEDNCYRNEEEAKIARESRRKGEQKRYIKRYGIDLEDENNYNLVIDTSYVDIDKIADTILECESKYQKGIQFEKNIFHTDNKKDDETR